MASSLPGYKKIAGIITERIHSGQYTPRSYLPSENQLALEFSVTRTTIRKALNILKQQGTIESFQGKGYRIKSLYWEQSLLQFYSFGRNIAEKIEYPETKVIEFRIIEGLNDVDEFKHNKLWKITRLRLMSDVPMILETSYIPLSFLPEVDSKVLEQNSLYNLLEDNDVHIIKAKEYLEPVNPSLEAQKLLDTNEKRPLFQTIRYTFNTDEELVELRESLIRCDNFRFSVEMTL